MEILIAIGIGLFAFGNFTGAVTNERRNSREYEQIGRLENENMNLSQRFGDPACDEICREKTSGKIRKNNIKLAKIERKKQAGAISALSMNTETR